MRLNGLKSAKVCNCSIWCLQQIIQQPWFPTFEQKSQIQSDSGTRAQMPEVTQHWQQNDERSKKIVKRKADPPVLGFL